MYRTHCDEINEGDNVIIGLGDSFTQGVGAYSLSTWESIPENPSKYNISGQMFLEEQGLNSWVRQLGVKFLNYKVFNLGVNGAGNRAAVRELYLNKLPNKLGNVIVILMATGVERYDFLKQSDETAGVNWHQKWQTIFPIISERGPISRLEKEYMGQIWSPRNDALEFLFNVSDAQNFCKSRGYKFMFASVFDTQINKAKLTNDLADKKEYIDMVDWKDFIDLGKYQTFMDMINQLEGNPPATMHQLFVQRSTTKVPSKYITPCTHWSIEGQYKVAEYLYNELLKRQLI